MKKIIFFLRDLRRDQRGFVIASLAVLVSVIIIMIALAVDVTYLVSTRARLDNALSMTGLAMATLPEAAGATVNPTGPEAAVLDAYSQAFFDANFSLAGVKAPPVVEVSYPNGQILVAASVEPIAPFISAVSDILGTELDFTSLSSVVVRESVEITREITGLEVVMVLDNTGSMSGNASPGISRIAALRTAAVDMVSILSGGEMFPPYLRMGLVPFVTTVNIRAGSSFKNSWMDLGAEAKFHGMNFAGFPTTRRNIFDMFDRISNASWKGCVEARPEPLDTNDVAPGDTEAGVPVADTYWVPWFWPDEPVNPPDEPTGDPDEPTGNFQNNYDPFDEVLVSTPTGEGFPAYPKFDWQRYLPSGGETVTVAQVDEVPSPTRGPNASCADPILDLTDDVLTTLIRVSNLAPWGGSGTNVAQGLIWGLRVLSPTEPFTRGAPYDDEEWQKAVVVLTDGRNQMVGAGGGPALLDSDFGPYGYAAQERLGAPGKDHIETRVNEKTLEVCSLIKSEGVLLYTIVLGPVQNTRTITNPETGETINTVTDLMAACATPADAENPDVTYAFVTPDAESLQNAFREIAIGLTNLRISG